jgi:hypothetical protein
MGHRVIVIAANRDRLMTFEPGDTGSGIWAVIYHIAAAEHVVKGPAILGDSVQSPGIAVKIRNKQDTHLRYSVKSLHAKAFPDLPEIGIQIAGETAIVS